MNDLKRRNSSYFAFFRRFRFLCWPNTSQWLNIVCKCCLSVPIFHFSPLLTHPAARSLCDSWATCFTARWLKTKIYHDDSVRLTVGHKTLNITSLTPSNSWSIKEKIKYAQYLRSKEDRIQWLAARDVIDAWRRQSAAWWLAPCYYVTCRWVVYVLASHMLWPPSVAWPRPAHRHQCQAHVAGQSLDTSPHHCHHAAQQQQLHPMVPVTWPLVWSPSVSRLSADPPAPASANLIS